MEAAAGIKALTKAMLACSGWNGLPLVFYFFRADQESSRINTELKRI